MERRDLLRLSGLAALIGLSRCARVRIPVLQPLLPPQPRYFQRSDTLFVNTDPQAHYYTEMPEEEGIQRLKELAETSPVEESFAHVTAGKYSFWFEVGEDERSNEVSEGKSIFTFLAELRNLPFHSEPIECTHYHLHIQEGIRRTEDNIPLKGATRHHYGFNGERDITTYFLPAIDRIPSDKDMTSHAVWTVIIPLTSIGKDVKVSPSRVITPEGIFSYYTDSYLNSLALNALKSEENAHQHVREAWISALMRSEEYSQRRAYLENSDSAQVTIEDILACFRPGKIHVNHMVIEYSPFSPS